MFSSDDGILKSAFFTLAAEAKREDDRVDFPLPENADRLAVFLQSPAGQAYRAGMHALIKELRRWLNAHQVEDKELDHFIKKYIDYSGSDRGENGIMLPLLQDGVPRLKKILNLLVEYPLEIARFGKPRPYQIQPDKLYLYTENDALWYAVKRPRKPIATFLLPRAALGQAVYSDIVEALTDPEQTLGDSTLRAIYKLTEKNGHYRPAAERRQQKQKDKMRNLIQGMAVCAPGCHTHIQNTQTALSAELSVILMEYRLTTFQDLILNAMKPFEARIHKGSPIHYVNVILNRYKSPFGFEVIKDTFHTVCHADLLQLITKQLLKNLLVQWKDHDSYREMVLSEFGREPATHDMHVRAGLTRTMIIERYQDPTKFPVVVTTKGSSPWEAYDEGLLTLLLRAQFTLPALVRFAYARCDLDYFRSRIQSRACTILLLTALPEDTQVLKHRYAGEYVLVAPVLTEPTLYCIDYDGSAEPVPLTDATLFRQGIQNKLDRSESQIRLTANETEKYIRANGGHVVRIPRRIRNEAVNDLTDEMEAFGEDALFDLGQILDMDELSFDKHVLRADAEFNLSISLLIKLVKAGFVDADKLYEPLTLSENTRAFISKWASADYDYVEQPSPDDSSAIVRQSYIVYSWERLIANQADNLFPKAMDGVKRKQLLLGYLKWIEARIQAADLSDRPEAMDELVDEAVLFLKHSVVRTLFQTANEGYPVLIDMISAFPQRYFERLCPEGIEAYVRRVTESGDLDWVKKKLAYLSQEQRLAYFQANNESKVDEVDARFRVLSLSADLFRTVTDGFEKNARDTLLVLVWRVAIRDLASNDIKRSSAASNNLADLVKITPTELMPRIFPASDHGITLSSVLWQWIHNQEIGIFPRWLMKKIGAESLEAALYENTGSSSVPVIRPHWRAAAASLGYLTIADLASAFPDFDRRTRVFQDLMQLTKTRPDKKNELKYIIREMRLAKPTDRVQQAALPACTEHYHSFADVMNMANALELYAKPKELFAFYEKVNAYQLYLMNQDPGHPVSFIEDMFFATADYSDYPSAITALFSLEYLRKKNSNIDLELGVKLHYILYVLAISFLFGRNYSRYSERSKQLSTFIDAMIEEARKTGFTAEEQQSVFKMLFYSKKVEYSFLEPGTFSRFFALLKPSDLNNYRGALAAIVSHLPEEYSHEIIKQYPPAEFNDAMLYNFMDAKSDTDFAAINLAKLMLLTSSETASRILTQIIRADEIKEVKEQAPPGLVAALPRLMVESSYSQLRQMLRQIDGETRQLFLQKGCDHPKSVLGEWFVTADYALNCLLLPHPYSRNVDTFLSLCSQQKIDALAALCLPVISRLSKENVPLTKSVFNGGLFKAIMLHASVECIDLFATDAFEALVVMANQFPVDDFKEIVGHLNINDLNLKLARFFQDGHLFLTENGLQAILSLGEAALFEQALNAKSINLAQSLYRLDPASFAQKWQSIKMNLSPLFINQCIAKAVTQTATAQDLELYCFASQQAVVKARLMDAEATFVGAELIIDMCMTQHKKGLDQLVNSFDPVMIDKIFTVARLTRVLNGPQDALKKIITKSSSNRLMDFVEYIKDINVKNEKLSADELSLDNFRLLIYKLPAKRFLKLIMEAKSIENLWPLIKVSNFSDFTRLKGHITVLLEKIPLESLRITSGGLSLSYLHDCYNLMNFPDIWIKDKHKKNSLQFIANAMKAIASDSSPMMNVDPWGTYLTNRINAWDENYTDKADFIRLMLFRVHLLHSASIENMNPQQSLKAAYLAALSIKNPAHLSGSQCMILSDFFWLHAFTDDHQALALSFLHAAAQKGDETAIDKLNKRLEPNAAPQDEVDEAKYRLTLLGTHKSKTIERAHKNLQRHLTQLEPGTSLRVACESADWSLAKKELLQMKSAAEHDEGRKHFLGEFYQTVMLLSELAQYKTQQEVKTESPQLIDTFEMNYMKARTALERCRYEAKPEGRVYQQADRCLNLLDEATSGIEKKTVIFALLQKGTHETLHERLWKGMGYHSEKAALMGIEKALKEEVEEVGVKMNEVVKEVKVMANLIAKHPEDGHACHLVLKKLQRLLKESPVLPGIKKGL